MRAGEYLEAKQYFNRVLEIDHDNRLANNRVKKLDTLLKL